MFIFYKSNFCKERNDLKSIEWKLINKQHSKQPRSDTTSCGVFVCKFAELLLASVTSKLSFETDSDSIMKYRREIHNKLDLNNSNPF